MAIPKETTRFELFEEGVDMRNCVNQAITFEVDNLMSFNEDYDNSDSDEDSSSHQDFLEASYEKLWNQMSPVGDGKFIRKCVITEGIQDDPIRDDSIVKVHFVGYCENSKKPIVSADELGVQVIKMKEEKCALGLTMALKTMKAGEISRFLLSYQVMYGEMGCPPLIPPKAMCLFIISVMDVQTLKESKDAAEEGETTFKKVYKVARDLHIKGTFYYKKSQYGNAISSFRHAERLVEFCRLADEVEEEKQQKFLAKLYINLGICYNSLNKPLKACCMFNNLFYMGRLMNNSKALLHNSRSLAMIGDFDKALKKIRMAQRMDPDCTDILNELKNIQEKKATADEIKQMLHSNMEVSFKLKQSSVDNNKSTVPRLTPDFVDCVENLCEKFSNDSETFKISLPPGLTKAESKVMIDVAKNYNLYCQCENDIVMSLSKMNLSREVLNLEE